MAEIVELEATTKRKRKHLQSTDGNESTPKAVVTSYKFATVHS
jgi:hypothetical protein